MPWGQKNSASEMIHSQIVTPPLAAIEGTTFRLKTATTKSRIRSRRPRTRFKCGWLASEVIGCHRMIGSLNERALHPDRISDTQSPDDLAARWPDPVSVLPP